MKHLIILLVIFSPFVAFGQELSKAKVVQDLEYLVENIKKYDPALSEYHPDFDQLTDQIIAGIPDGSITSLEYFTLVSEICTLANEGHFSLGDWEDDVHKGFGANVYKYLPVGVKVFSGRLFVASDYSNEQQLSRGDEIISINGMSATEVLDKLVKTMPSDGEIITYAQKRVEEGFPWLYYFYVDQPEVFEFKVKDASQNEKSVSVTALIRSDQVKNVEKYLPKKEESSAEGGFYALEYTDDYAMLTLSSFDWRRVNKYEVKAKNMYKEIFQELQDKNVQNLIVDLRYNTGGRNEFADEMVPFIAKSELNDKYLKKTISWEGKERTYSLSKPSKLAFQGSVYVLVNGKTFSAGASLSRYLKEYANATVIGTETGTRYEGFAAGSSQDINLPNSGMRIGIPRYHILYPPSDKQRTSNRGLIPDHEITETFEAYDAETDLHLEKARELIK